MATQMPELSLDYQPHWCCMALGARTSSGELVSLVGLGGTGQRTLIAHLSGPLEDLDDFLWVGADVITGNQTAAPEELNRRLSTFLNRLPLLADSPLRGTVTAAAGEPAAANGNDNGKDNSNGRGE